MKRIVSFFLLGLLFVFPRSCAFAQQPKIDEKSIKNDQPIGTLDDCKNILSDGCRTYLMQANASDILSKYSDAYIFEGNELVCNRFRAKLDKYSKDILEAEFVGFDKNPYGLQPNENLKWGATMKNVKKQYGEPLEILTDKGFVTYFYKNFELLFYQSKNYTLHRLYLRKYISKEEIAAAEKLKIEKQEAARKAEEAKPKPAPVAIKPKKTSVNDPNIDLILAVVKKAPEEKGAVLIASGITDFNLIREDALFRWTQPGDVYLFAMVSEFDPQLDVNMQTYYDGPVRTPSEYKTFYDKSRSGNYSVVIYTAIIFPDAQSMSIQFKPSCSGDVHWVLYRTR